MQVYKTTMKYHYFLLSFLLLPSFFYAETVEPQSEKTTQKMWDHGTWRKVAGIGWLGALFGGFFTIVGSLRVREIAALKAMYMAEDHINLYLPEDNKEDIQGSPYFPIIIEKFMKGTPPLKFGVTTKNGRQQVTIPVLEDRDYIKYKNRILNSTIALRVGFALLAIAACPIIYGLIEKMISKLKSKSNKETQTNNQAN
jgi:ABC-type phosphate transport system permease subunit